jgi:hypothetical protein
MYHVGTAKKEYLTWSLILFYNDKEFKSFVRYHCGGWSEEVNSCILILSYMIYLLPKHSLGYQLHSYPTLLYTHNQIIIYTHN